MLKSALSGAGHRGLLDIATHTMYVSPGIRTLRRRAWKRPFQDGDQRGVRADQVGRIGDVLGHLDGAQRPSDLDLPGYRLHAFKGDLKGMWSVTISGNWRFVDGDAFDVDLVDYH